MENSMENVCTSHVDGKYINDVFNNKKRWSNCFIDLRIIDESIIGAFLFLFS